MFVTEHVAVVDDHNFLQVRQTLKERQHLVDMLLIFCHQHRSTAVLKHIFCFIA